jgi:hypothetical protein
MMRIVAGRARILPTSERDGRVLRSFARYYVLTAEQINRLHYGRSVNFVSQRLAEFTRGGLLTRQALPLPRLRGNRPYVYRLGNLGRRYLESIGVELPKRSHHSPDHPYTFIGLDHTLALNDFLIALTLFCRAHEGFAITRLIHERSFIGRGNYDRVEVQVGEGPVEVISVQPDAWIELQTPQGPVYWTVEVDMGTETQAKYRRKVRGLLAWFQSDAYEQRFGVAESIVPVAVIPGAKRRQELAGWTEAELRTLHQEHMAEHFGFCDLHPGQVAPDQYFSSPVWHPLGASQPVPLLRS